MNVFEIVGYITIAALILIGAGNILFYLAVQVLGRIDNMIQPGGYTFNGMVGSAPKMPESISDCGEFTLGECVDD